MTVQFEINRQNKTWSIYMNRWKECWARRSKSTQIQAAPISKKICILLIKFSLSQQANGTNNDRLRLLTRSRRHVNFDERFSMSISYHLVYLCFSNANNNIWSWKIACFKNDDEIYEQYCASFHIYFGNSSIIVEFQAK